MRILGDFTLDQLRQATVTQIRTAISNKIANMSKKQLIILILKVADIDIENLEIQDSETGQDGSNGQLWRLRIIKDVLGNKLRSQKIEWSYYPEGNVNEIWTYEFDSNDVEISRKGIKHIGNKAIQI